MGIGKTAVAAISVLLMSGGTALATDFFIWHKIKNNKPTCAVATSKDGTWRKVAGPYDSKWEACRAMSDGQNDDVKTLCQGADREGCATP
jgi:hypothetical protein